MNGKWTLTVRDGPRVGHKRFESLSETVEAMERELDELIPTAKRRAGRSPIGHLAGKRFDAARQVAVRAEVAGPGGWLGGVRGGVDMRGDGSIEAYTGRLRRRLVELRTGETAYEGLRRALEEGT
ncbi:MAG: hypothetical protein ACHQDY_08560 [Solirubrobacterales bacterium]